MVTPQKPPVLAFPPERGRLDRRVTGCMVPVQRADVSLCGLRNNLLTGGKCWLKRHVNVREGGGAYALSIIVTRWACSQ